MQVWSRGVAVRVLVSKGCSCSSGLEGGCLVSGGGGGGAVGGLVLMRGGGGAVRSLVSRGAVGG